MNDKFFKENKDILFFKILMPFFFIITVFLFFNNVISIYNETKKFILEKTFNYETVKKELVLLLGIFSPIRLMANCLYINDLLNPSFKKILNILLRIINFILPVSFLIIFILFISFITQDIFIIDSVFLSTIRNPVENFLIKIFPNSNYYNSFPYLIGIITFLGMYFPKNIDFLYTVQKHSIFRRLILIVLYIPFKMFDIFEKKITGKKSLMIIYNYLKENLYLLPDKIADILKDFFEIKDMVQDEGFDKDNPTFGE